MMEDQRGSAFTTEAQHRTGKPRGSHKATQKCDSQKPTSTNLPTDNNNHHSHPKDHHPRTTAQRVPLIHFGTLPQPLPHNMSNANGSGAGMKPLPETVVHSSKRLTHREAHGMLSEFLKKAEVDAAYRPDSTLTERGPQSTSSGPNSNLTLHHLSRILQGIEGKNLGPDLDIHKFFGEGAGKKATAGKKAQNGGGVGGGDGAMDATDAAAGMASSPPAGRHAKRKTFEDQHYEDGDDAVGIAVADEADGWQDKENYDLAQREGGLELLGEDKQPGIHLKQPASRREAEDVMAVDVHNKAGGVVDKKAKKDAKKARKNIDKKQRQEARKKD